MPSASLRKRRRADEDDEEFDRPAASRPWWWRLLLRRPRDSFAFLVAAGAAVAIIVNSVYLQHGPHPAPIFSVHPLPVAGARDTVGSLQNLNATDLQPVRQGPVEQPRTRSIVVQQTSAQQASVQQISAQQAPVQQSPVQQTVAPRKDAIAELLDANPPQSHAAHAQQPARAAEVPQQANQSASASTAPVHVPTRSLAQPSRQVLAVQRALSDFGYGQIKLTGIYDSETQAAVQHFERDRHLPVTSDISDAAKHELGKLVGHDLD